MIFFSNLFFKDNFSINSCLKISKEHFKTQETITQEFSKCINSLDFLDKSKKEDIINHLYFPDGTPTKVELLKYN